MASVFKRNRHEPVPVGAEIIEHDGKRLARWKDARGKSQQTSRNAAGTKVVLPPSKDDSYYVAFDDENGQRKTVKAYKDKESSETMGKRLEDEAARRKEGITDPFEEHRRTPIGQHVEAFFAGQRAKRAPQKRMQIERIIEATKAARLQDLDAPQIEAFLDLLQRTQET